MASRLICGLGNPGPKYSMTRHNAGFLALDAFIQSEDPGAKWKSKFDGEIAEISLNGHTVIGLKPMTFMNRSGRSVQAALKFYGIKITETLVLHDEIELLFGELKGKDGGGHKGHNGLRDIIALCGSADFSRIRIGVGRPEHGGVADYVLSPFSPDQRSELPDFLTDCTKLIHHWLEDSLAGSAEG